MSDAIARTFTCEDCNYIIHNFGYDDGLNICGLCRWLRTLDASAEERLRLLKLARGDDDDDSSAPRKLN
jgi:hypothetical protein